MIQQFIVNLLYQIPRDFRPFLSRLTGQQWSFVKRVLDAKYFTNTQKLYNLPIIIAGKIHAYCKQKMMPRLEGAMDRDIYYLSEKIAKITPESVFLDTNKRHNALI